MSFEQQNSHETEDSSSSVAPLVRENGPWSAGIRVQGPRVVASSSSSSSDSSSSSSSESSSVSRSEQPSVEEISQAPQIENDTPVEEQHVMTMPPAWIGFSVIIAMMAVVELPSFPTTALFVAAITTIVYFHDKVTQSNSATRRMLIFAALYMACTAIWFTVKWQLRIRTIEITTANVDRLRYFLAFLRRNYLQSLFWPGSLIVTVIRGYVLPLIYKIGNGIANGYAQMMQ